MTEKLCHAVVELCREVREFILAERLVFQSSAVELKGHNDLVSYVDRTAEHKLVEGLGKLLPEAGFLTEESTVARRDASLQWIIDPLDGTTNFIHGIPCFCISIALYRNTTPVLGVVHELNLDECFYAWENGGAYLNGSPIRVSSAYQLGHSLIATGFPYHNFDRMTSYMEVFDYCMRNTRGLRRLGSAAADLAYVAAGRFDAFYEYGLNPWDVAAGILLVREAGGRVTDFSGGTQPIEAKEILASNSSVHDEMLGVISDRFNQD